MNRDLEDDYPVYPPTMSRGDRGSRPYVVPLAVLHEFLSRYPVNEPIASIQLAVGQDGEPRVVVRLGATRLSQIAQGLIEWHFTLSHHDVTIHRSGDGHTAQLEVTGNDDVGGIPITVVSGPVPCQYLRSVDVDIEFIDPGAEDQVEVLALYRWALGYPFDTDNLSQEPPTDDAGRAVEGETP